MKSCDSHVILHHCYVTAECIPKGQLMHENLSIQWDTLGTCIERCSHFRGKFIAFWDTAVSLIQRCPFKKGSTVYSRLSSSHRYSVTHTHTHTLHHTPPLLARFSQPRHPHRPRFLQARSHDDLHHRGHAHPHGSGVIWRLVRQLSRHLRLWDPLLVHLCQRHQIAWGLRRLSKQGTAVDGSSERSQTGTAPEIRHGLLGTDDHLLAWRFVAEAADWRRSAKTAFNYEENRAQALKMNVVSTQS